MVRIAIIAHTAAYGNAAVLAEGMRSFASVETMFPMSDVKGMYPAKVSNRLPEADHYIVVGAVSLSHLPKKYWSKGVTVILTDSTYMNNPQKYNPVFRANSFRVWAMPDLAAKAETDNIYYQPFIMPEVDKRKTDLICHSPYCEEKMKQKGTTLITAICSKNNLPVTVIIGKKWKESIDIKARHLYFVDQLYRGIGKSGLEAMLLDCAVITGVKPECNYLPPVVWSDAKNFEQDLLTLIFDKKLTKEVINKQRIWALKNLDAKFVAQRILKDV